MYSFEFTCQQSPSWHVGIRRNFRHPSRPPFATFSRMKYDDSEYYFLNFETDLDNHAANTHSGMYLAWAILSGLGRDDDELANWAPDVARLKARETTGAHLLSDLCDGKLMDSEFNAEGNAFTADYYEKDFHHDYARVFD
eukprot:gene5790-7188_t